MERAGRAVPEQDIARRRQPGPLDREGPLIAVVENARDQRLDEVPETRLGPELAVPVAQQRRDPGAVGRGEIQLAVAVEIARADCGGVRLDGVTILELERA